MLTKGLFVCIALDKVEIFKTFITMYGICDVLLN